MVIRTFKAVRLFNHILLGLVLLVLTGAVWNNRTRLLKATKQWWLGRTTRLLGMEIELIGEFPTPPGDVGFLLVSNHVSWTDIPVIGSLSRINFLSKAEVKNWPLVGRLANTTGTLFIQRGAGNTDGVSRQIADSIAQGRSVLFFPEGTTSDGRSVGRFHRKLFRTCEHVHTQVLPLAIHYEVDGLDQETLDAQYAGSNPVAFIGDDEFTQHIWRLLSFSKVKGKVAVLPPRTLDMSCLEQEVNAIRREIQTQVEYFNAQRPSVNTISTSARSPGASSHADQPGEAASF
ncbi:MAG TPA: lysophospholipid acyltransferase family protein [Dongiaceae bacterium]|nr:lysophospholipid acyltransferase family protein [Dongiaceae bacterium]